MFVTNAFFLAAWNPLTPLRSALAAGSINLVLDLFLVNVVGWGIAGAAVATVCAQAGSFSLSLFLRAPPAAFLVVVQLASSLCHQKTASLDFDRCFFGLPQERALAG